MTLIRRIAPILAVCTCSNKQFLLPERSLMERSSSTDSIIATTKASLGRASMTIEWRDCSKKGEMV
jgi:hypothetical protein